MQGREDILRHLFIDSTDPDNERGVFITKSCPFLQKDEHGPLYSCRIHDTKPLCCSTYPDDGVCEHGSDGEATEGYDA